jgi:type I restriction enzyme S subunit
MAGEWRTARIEEVAERVAMGPFGSSIKVETFVPEGVPVISGQHLHGWRVDGSAGFNFITPEHAEKLRNANVRRGDVIFTHRGTIGQVSYLPPSSAYDRYVISQSQFFLRPDLNKALPEYLVAYFRSPEGQHKLLANTSQVGVPSIAQPVTYLRSIEIPLPPLPEQHAIAHILGTLDDKIELNRKQNETLGAMARALFKAWFVDFEPVRAKIEGRWQRGQSLPGLPAHLYDLFPDRLVESELGEIPEGWEVRSLDSIANYLNGLALQKFPPESDDEFLPVIKIAQLRAGNTNGADRASARIKPEYVVVDGDVLFSWSGSLEMVIWCGGRGALNQHLFKITSNEVPKWFYYYATLHHLPAFRAIAAGKATTMGHIQRKHLTDARIAVAPLSDMKNFDAFISPLFDQMVNIAQQSRTLAQLRDTLLPKLISGALRVKDAEKFLEKKRETPCH